jgi:hypothetical protein
LDNNGRAWSDFLDVTSGGVTGVAGGCPAGIIGFGRIIERACGCGRGPGGCDADIEPAKSDLGGGRGRAFAHASDAWVLTRNESSGTHVYSYKKESEIAKRIYERIVRLLCPFGGCLG